MADYAMSFELGQWMSERARSPTLAHPQRRRSPCWNGAVTAVVVGPVSDGVRDGCARSSASIPTPSITTPRSSPAIAATLIRHNAISEALSTRR